MSNCALFSITYKDEAFINKGFFVALKSLRRTNPDLPVFVFYDELKESVLEKIKLNGAVPILLNAKTYPAYAKEFNSINTTFRPDLTKATWFKLFLGKLAEVGQFDKVLFLDSDIVVLDDVGELFNSDAVFMAAYSDRELKSDYANPKKIQKLENINIGGVFNAGVFVADIKYWNDNNLTQKAFEIVSKYGVEEFVCADQGVINILVNRYCKNILKLPSIYNFCRYHDMRLSPQLFVGLNQKGILAPLLNEKFIKILHWNGSVKPWDNTIEESKDIEYSKLYVDCYNQFSQSNKTKKDLNKLKVGIVTMFPITRTETFIRHHIEVLDATHFAVNLTPGIQEAYLRISSENRFKLFVEENNVNVVLAEFGPAAAHINDVCRDLSLPLIVHFHGYDASRNEVLKKYGSQYIKVFKDAFAIIVVSRAMERKLIELGAPAKKILYNPCGVDVKKFYPVTSNKLYTETKGAQIKKPTFMFIGRFVEKKSPTNTIKAFAKALPKISGARLIMYGEGPLLLDSKKLVKDLGISKFVEFRNSCEHNEVPSVLRSADIYVQHSLTASNGDSEGTPVTILEAGAIGLPVISTRHAGIPDVVVDQKTGILVNEGDVAGMAQAMITLSKDRERCISMGKQAREYISKNFSDHIADARLKKVTQKAFDYAKKTVIKPKKVSMIKKGVSMSVSFRAARHLDSFIDAVIKFKRTKELFVLLNIGFISALILVWRIYGVAAFIFGTLTFIVFVQAELFIIFRVLKKSAEEKADYLAIHAKRNFENLTRTLNGLKEISRDSERKLENRFENKINLTKSEIATDLSLNIKKLNEQLDLDVKNLEDRINSNRKGLESNLNSNVKRLDNRIDSNKKEADSHLNLNVKRLDGRIDTAKKDLVNRVELVRNDLINDLDRSVEVLSLISAKIPIFENKITDLSLNVGSNIKKLEDRIGSNKKEADSHLNSNVKRLDNRIDSMADLTERNTLHQVQDYATLNALLKPVLDKNKGLPYMMHYAVAPDFAKKIAEIILEKKPQVIVELGSGVSTIISAYCLKLNSTGKIHSFDHLKDFGDKTSAMIHDHGLEQFADVNVAPIDQIRINDNEYPWYSANSFEQIDLIDMLIVDGPPGKLAPLSRFPALPLLFKKLKPGATVVLDDVKREDERQIVELWRKEFPDMSYKFLDTERGTGVFTINN